MFFTTLPSKLETLLIKFNKTPWAQHLRHIQHTHFPKRTPQDTEWPKDIIIMDTRLRELGQREIYLREQLFSLTENTTNDPPNPSDQAQLTALQTELSDLARRYWHLEREFYRREASVPAGPLARAYKTCTADERWYLLGYLRYDCAGRGGCCGRGCGCCEKARNTEKRVRLGHCTIECGCCRRARGFELTSEDQVRYQKLFDCNLKENEGLAGALVRAYVFGFV
ncbi:hypothetical protein BBP40_002856 [Aspergillus hancockii]|nr:hypothetical protein BBP40_002856 [Aspergillus hancockii]